MVSPLLSQAEVRHGAAASWSHLLACSALWWYETPLLCRPLGHKNMACHTLMQHVWDPNTHSVWYHDRNLPLHGSVQDVQHTQHNQPLSLWQYTVKRGWHSYTSSCRWIRAACLPADMIVLEDSQFLFAPKAVWKISRQGLCWTTLASHKNTKPNSHFRKIPSHASAPSRIPVSSFWHVDDPVLPLFK